MYIPRLVKVRNPIIFKEEKRSYAAFDRFSFIFIKVHLSMNKIFKKSIRVRIEDK